MTLEEYLNLIPVNNRQQPDFVAMVTMNVAVPLRVQELLEDMSTTLFDIDVAVGDQLDIIGKWVGISRNVSVPIENVYFTWDGDASLGWDFGTWQPSLAPTSVTSLPDDAYRTLLKAKIAANKWDGTTTAAYAIWDALFPEFTILIQDLQDMSYNMIILGGIIDSLTLALIVGGYIQLKPEGVRINAYYVSTDDNPGFAWDLETDNLKGWDEGSWTREFTPT